MTIEKRAFGRTGHMSSVVIFGGAALKAADQATADRTLDLLFESGGPALPGHRLLGMGKGSGQEHEQDRKDAHALSNPCHVAGFPLFPVTVPPCSPSASESSASAPSATS